MKIFVRVGENQYPAVITGRISDSGWDDRATKSIRLEMGYQDAVNIFVNGVKWSIEQQFEDVIEELDENGEMVIKTIVKTDSFDNSEYNLAGDITDHRDGTITIKMGKLTELEEAYEIMLGGIE